MNQYEVNQLTHHGVLGMHWGIRRYQPYPKGYHGDGKFTGDLTGNPPIYTLKKTKGEKRAAKAAIKAARSPNEKRVQKWTVGGGVIGGPAGALAGGTAALLYGKKHPEGNRPDRYKLYDLQRPGENASKKKQQRAKDLSSYKAKIMVKGDAKEILRNASIFTDQELRQCLRSARFDVDRKIARANPDLTRWERSMSDDKFLQYVEGLAKKADNWADLHSGDYDQMNKALEILIKEERNIPKSAKR